MDSITQDIKFRLSLIKYADKYGVTKAAIKYKTNRQYIYRWKRRYDEQLYLTITLKKKQKYCRIKTINLVRLI